MYFTFALRPRNCPAVAFNGTPILSAEWWFDGNGIDCLSYEKLKSILELANYRVRVKKYRIFLHLVRNRIGSESIISFFFSLLINIIPASVDDFRFLLSPIVCTRPRHSPTQPKLTISVHIQRFRDAPRFSTWTDIFQCFLWRTGDNMNLFLNENWTVLLNEMQPTFEEALRAALVAIAQQFFNRIPLNDIFIE